MGTWAGRKMVAGKGPTDYKANAHEVWQAGDWTWYVLKKNQSPESEGTNPYASWFCLVTSPFVGESGEMGDTYIQEIKNQGAVKIR